MLRLCLTLNSSYVVPVLHRFRHHHPQALYVSFLYFSLYEHLLARSPVQMLHRFLISQKDLDSKDLPYEQTYDHIHREKKKTEDI